MSERIVWRIKNYANLYLTDGGHWTANGRTATNYDSWLSAAQTVIAGNVGGSRPVKVKIRKKTKVLRPSVHEIVTTDGDDIRVNGVFITCGWDREHGTIIRARLIDALAPLFPPKEGGQ
jgi:hypothetical protein